MGAVVGESAGSARQQVDRAGDVQRAGDVRAAVSDERWIVLYAGKRDGDGDPIGGCGTRATLRDSIILRGAR